MNKKKQITLEIELDGKDTPQTISWQAGDADVNVKKFADAFLLSIWDKDENITLGIDLWTNKMLVENMNILFHQTFLKMADTYIRASNNFEISEMVRRFADQFAGKLSLLKK